MKKLTIEQKAQRYDEAISMAKKFHTPDSNNTNLKATLEMIFSELKESEDEKIRKEMLQIAKESEDSFYMVMTPNKRERLIAWLEKQGEQKPVISNDALREGIAHFGITQHQIDNWLKKYVDVEKQGEQELLVTNVEKNIHPIVVKKTGVGRCAVAHEQKPADKVEPKFHEGE